MCLLSRLWCETCAADTIHRILTCIHCQSVQLPASAVAMKPRQRSFRKHVLSGAKKRAMRGAKAPGVYRTQAERDRVDAVLHGKALTA